MKSRNNPNAIAGFEQQQRLVSQIVTVVTKLAHSFLAYLHEFALDQPQIALDQPHILFSREAFDVYNSLQFYHLVQQVCTTVQGHQGVLPHATRDAIRLALLEHKARLEHEGVVFPALARDHLSQSLNAQYALLVTNSSELVATRLVPSLHKCFLSRILGRLFSTTLHADAAPYPPPQPNPANNEPPAAPLELDAARARRARELARLGVALATGKVHPVWVRGVENAPITMEVTQNMVEILRPFLDEQLHVSREPKRTARFTAQIIGADAEVEYQTVTVLPLSDHEIRLIFEIAADIVTSFPELITRETIPFPDGSTIFNLFCAPIMKRYPICYYQFRSRLASNTTWVLSAQNRAVESSRETAFPQLNLAARFLHLNPTTLKEFMHFMGIAAVAGEAYIGTVKRMFGRAPKSYCNYRLTTNGRAIHWQSVTSTNTGVCNERPTGKFGNLLEVGRTVVGRSRREIQEGHQIQADATASIADVADRDASVVQRGRQSLTLDELHNDLNLPNGIYHHGLNFFAAIPQVPEAGSVARNIVFADPGHVNLFSFVTDHDHDDPRYRTYSLSNHEYRSLTGTENRQREGQFQREEFEHEFEILSGSDSNHFLHTALLRHTRDYFGMWARLLNHAFRPYLRNHLFRNYQSRQRFVHVLLDKLRAMHPNGELPIIVCGNGCNNPTSRGHPTAPGMPLLRALSQHVIIIMCDERFTSQKCPNCRHQIMHGRYDANAAATKQGHPIRGLSHCTNCGLTFNRDEGAACLLRYVFHHQAVNGTTVSPLAGVPAAVGAGAAGAGAAGGEQIQPNPG